MSAIFTCLLEKTYFNASKVWCMLLMCSWHAPYSLSWDKKFCLLLVTCAVSYVKVFFLFLKKCNNKFLEKLMKATLKSSSRLIKSILLAIILPSWYYTNILDFQVFYIHVGKYFELCPK